MSLSVGLVGARGHVGRELIRILAQDPDFEIAFATSRDVAGIQDIDGTKVRFANLNPEEVAQQGCDALVLGLPNGLSAPYVDAVGRHAPGMLVINLSTDHRGTEGWAYGLPELGTKSIAAARRIANPGCYATAGILALWPLRRLIEGVPSVIGMSGYSGAGTTPSEKNDQDRLFENVLPYGFSGHAHEAEIGRALGHAVAFAPHVMPFFRGLLVTATAPIGRGRSKADLEALYGEAYEGSSAVKVQAEPPEPQAVAGTPQAIVGGFAYNEATGVATVACALDNLLKGAASQAHANLRLASGLPL